MIRKLISTTILSAAVAGTLALAGAGTASAGTGIGCAVGAAIDATK